MNKTGCNGAYCHCHRRILVVDNDPAVRTDHAELLRLWGYQPILVEATGDDLIRLAPQIAHDQRCHLALVDIRLRDDDDPSDRSGLHLVPNLLPVRSVIVTGFGDLKAARDAQATYQALSVVGKEEGPEALHECICAGLQESCVSSLRIQWPEDLTPSDIVRRLALHPADLTIDQPGIALCKLYGDRPASPSVAAVELNLLHNHYRTEASAASSDHAIILVAHAQEREGRWGQSREIVKLAPQIDIQRESTAYRQYVSPHLDPLYSARIEDSENSVVLCDIGAIRYTNIGAEDRMPFQAWYQRPGVKVEFLLAGLTHLFQHTLLPWYQLQTEKTNQLLFDYYRNIFAKLRRLEDYLGQNPPPIPLGWPANLPNPVAWVRAHAAESHFTSHWQAITHGDLHGNNIIITRNAEASILDYERTGPGHILRDFVELEADTLLRLVSWAGISPKQVLQFALTLLEQRKPKDVVSTPPLFDGELHKAYQVVQHLRQLAFDITQVNDLSQYYWTLLVDSLLYALATEPEHLPIRQWPQSWAWWWCALLCIRLDQWDKSWPPADWQLDKE